MVDISSSISQGSRKIVYFYFSRPNKNSAIGLFCERERLRKVAKAAAYVMYQKSYLMKAMKVWRRHSRRSVALRVAFRAGQRLQKALAVKRWKSYNMLLVNKRRYTRRILLQWRAQIECEKLLYKWKLMNRVFLRVRRACIEEKKRR